MKIRLILFLLLCAIPTFYIFANEDESGQAETKRLHIVSVDASVTEILFALGCGDQIVGRDQTSIYPVEALEIPDVGGHPSLNAEGILKLRPQLLIGTDRMKPASIKDQLRGAGVNVEIISKVPTVEGARNKIKTIAKLVDKVAEGQALIIKMEEELEVLNKKIESLGDKKRPRVLSLYLRGPHTTFLMGEDNGSVGLVKTAGGEICLPGMKHPKPMNAEAVIAARPDAFLVFVTGLQSVGGVEGFMKLPGVAQTPAGKNKRIIAMDDVLLSSFGPRTGQAALELFHAMFENNSTYLSEVK